MTLPVSPVAWLLSCAVLVQVIAGGAPGGATVALVAAAVLYGLATQLVVTSTPHTRNVIASTPASRRLHGRFLQQSRPGVPGRIRARAPGCGH